MVSFNPLDANAEVSISDRNLPHWFQVGAAMFVTFRCADSMPQEVVLRRRQELQEWLRQQTATSGTGQGPWLGIPDVIRMQSPGT